MKRVNNIFDQVVSIENLTLADKKARKGKRNSIGVKIHDRRREQNIIALHELLVSKKFTTSKYHVFTIHEPKERLNLSNMKTFSNKQLPMTPIKWKDNEMAVFANHSYEGKSEEGDDVYSADMTISKSSELNDIMDAFNRQVNDTSLDDAVIYNFDIDGIKAIEKDYEGIEKAPASIFPALPSEGQLMEGEIYSYNNGAVKVRQSHVRTIYSPEETPALFTFYREITEGQLWISGEEVEAGSTREYDGVMYECIQTHVTQDDWTPDMSPTLWKEQQSEIPEWVQPTGGHDAYYIGDLVIFEDKAYESLIDANVWSPTAYPAGWREI